MKTKTFLPLLLLVASIGAAHAQDAAFANAQPADNQPGNYEPADSQPAVCLPPPPAVVYEAPVVYAAPVVYQAPVVYYAPVYYGVTPAACALNACGAVQNNAALSTVTYIGGGHVGYQVSSPCNNSGSTLVFIGGHSH
jgi:hypothetical protein